MILTGSLPGQSAVPWRSAATRSSPSSGPCRIWNYVHLYAGTLEVDSEIHDGGVYSGAITTGSGNGGTNFITVPAGTPIEVGMSIVHGRLADGTTILAITDINADPVVAEISSNSDGTTRTETGYIGMAGALGICQPERRQPALASTTRPSSMTVPTTAPTGPSRSTTATPPPGRSSVAAP